MARFTSLLGTTDANTAIRDGAGTNYIVQTLSGDLYCIYPQITGLVYRKSTDGGVSWGAPVDIMATTSRVITQVSIWYDRWSGIAGGLIHVAYTNTATDDTEYRSIDTENSDTLSSETLIFTPGASTALGGALSITRARGGNLYCKTMIDAGGEGGFFRSTDVGATWGARTDSEAMATTDQWILLPGWAADNQDIMMFFWDASADEISRVLYDNSGDAWAETSIAGTMVDQAATTSYSNISAAVDITNSRNLLAAWSAVDLANADLRVWHVTESAITEVTNVITNSTDDQGMCAIGIDTDTQDWYVVYGGATGGAETFATALNFYYKISTDDGATWGSETLLNSEDGIIAGSQSCLFMTPRFATNFSVFRWDLFSGGTWFGVNSEAPTVSGGGTTYPRAGLQGIDGGIFP